jgi:CRISPR-associated protein Cmr3
MTPLLLEPTDVLFFRDGIPMSAGQGHGAGCRLPFPSTVHEAFRHSLLRLHGREARGKLLIGRDEKKISTTAYQSLRLRGPLPWHTEHGHLFPVPLDASGAPGGGIKAHRLLPLKDGAINQTPSAFTPSCVPAPDVPPSKQASLTGWWAAEQMRQYLTGETNFDPTPIPTDKLWLEEPRIGVAIQPERLAAEDGQLFAGTYLRPQSGTRFAVQAGLTRPINGESHEMADFLDQGFLLLGGDRRIARLHQQNAAWPLFEQPAEVSGDGPYIVRWVLITPAIFIHGSLPGWCQSSDPSHSLPDGQVCLREKNAPHLKAHLIAHHLGRPMPVTGWDGVDGCPKPTQLAVPAGSVYHFLCADATTANALGVLLHDRNRSDFYGEKGCGHGLCARPYQPMSPDLRSFATRFFDA